MKHLIEIGAASHDPITPEQMILAYVFGYHKGALILLKEYEKVIASTEATRHALLRLASTMMVSQRALRLKSALDFHDLRKVPGAEKYLIFDSLKTYSLSLGVCVGSFVMNSLMLSLIGKNTAVCSMESYLLILDKFHLDRESVRGFSISSICEAASELIESKKDLGLTALQIMGGDRDVGKQCDAVIRAVDARMSLYEEQASGEHGVCHADETLAADQSKLPIIMKMQLPKPTMGGITPADPVEREAFWKIIQKSPGYGLSFWELMRELGKHHGAYFQPEFGLADAFQATRSREEGRRIIDELDERTWE